MPDSQLSYPGADWPALPYGSLSPDDQLPKKRIYHIINELVGRTIPTAAPKQVNKRWYHMHIWLPEHDSREIAYRLFRGSGGANLSFQDWCKGCGTRADVGKAIDLRKGGRTRFLYAPSTGWFKKLMGFQHNAFLPTVWMEKNHQPRLWLEYYLSTRKPDTVRLYTGTFPLTKGTDIQTRSAWLKDKVIPMIRDIAKQNDASLIFWRIDWGNVQADLQTNLHIHFVIEGTEDPFFSKARSLRQKLVTGIPEMAFFSFGLALNRCPTSPRLPVFARGRSTLSIDH
jgi:hypothetical protein